MDIAEFLTARLDETAERAQLAQTVIGGDWDGWEPIAHQLAADCDTVPFAGRLDQHLHYNADPARVLAEVKLKRDLLDRLERAKVRHQELEKFRSEPFHAFERGDALGRYRALQRLVATMAELYADRPDYDPAWQQLGLS